MKTTPKKSRRNPGKTTPRLIHMTDDLFKAIDRWRASQEDVPNRSEAVRRMVWSVIKAQSRQEAPSR